MTMVNLLYIYFLTVLLDIIILLVLYSGKSRGGGRGPAPPPRNAPGVVNSSFFPKYIYIKMSYDVEFSKSLLNIL